MKSLAIVRGDDISKVKTALYDLIRYAHLTFINKPRILEPEFADSALVRIMKTPLKSCCKAAAIIQLENRPGDAIERIRKIHPPSHIVIVSPRHEIFGDLVNYIGLLPEIELNLEQENLENIYDKEYNGKRLKNLDDAI